VKLIVRQQNAKFQQLYKDQRTLNSTEREGKETNRFVSFWRILERALRNEIQQNSFPDGFMA
jgi:hypothetical protein